MSVHVNGRLAWLGVCWLALLVSAPGAAASGHESAGQADWELTGAPAPVRRLVTGAGGTLFAATSTAFVRTADGGDTWRPVSTGPAATVLAVDPTNDLVLYGAAGDGVYRSTDGGGSWQRILSYAEGTGGRTLAVAASPAEPNLLYLALAGRPAISGELHFLRSRDAGATWQQLEQHQFSLCGWSVPILQPHPTDAGRLFRVADCIAGRNFGQSLSESTTAGESWTAIFNPEPGRSPFLGFPERLVGGQGRAPGRFYLAVNQDRRVGGAAVYRSDDDGATWREVLVTPGDAPRGNVRLGALAFDPAQPDAVYVGRQVVPSSADPPAGGGVAGSLDGGATWLDVGSQEIGAVNDLALSLDGHRLYAATDQGVWRLNLAAWRGQECGGSVKGAARVPVQVPVPARCHPRSADGKPRHRPRP